MTGRPPWGLHGKGAPWSAGLSRHPTVVLGTGKGIPHLSGKVCDRDESQNHEGWKSPLRSPGPTPSLPITPTVTALSATSLEHLWDGEPSLLGSCASAALLFWRSSFS